MPKKGENSKAVEAKARKAEAAKQVKDKKEKAAEDASWEDNDRNLARKQNRKVFPTFLNVLKVLLINAMILCPRK